MSLEELQKKLEECEKERDAYLDGWRRAKADYINYKNDELKRLEEVAKFGSEDLIKELLSVFDSFNAFERTAQDEQLKERMRPIKSQLETVLKKRGLEKIEVSLGSKFDPSYHEALQEVESDQAPGTIAEIAEEGWKLHGKVIRATKVKLSK